MAGRLAQSLDQWRLRKMQAYWAGVAEDAAGMDPFTLKQCRARARAMRRELDRVILAADHRLGPPALAAGLPRLPLGTDWAWRPDAWRGALALPGAVASGPKTELSDDLTLYHDCPLGEVVARQNRNTHEADRAPFGLAIDVFGFRGSFLSLAMPLPRDAVTGLRVRHLVRLDMVADSDRTLRGFVRLNIKHGPNVAQLVSGLPSDSSEKLAEFDLAYAGIDESRIESAWLDLIFNDAAMTRIDVRDVVVSRRPRAEV